eukprot:403349285
MGNIANQVCLDENEAYSLSDAKYKQQVDAASDYQVHIHKRRRNYKNGDIAVDIREEYVHQPKNQKGIRKNNPLKSDYAVNPESSKLQQSDLNKLHSVAISFSRRGRRYPLCAPAAQEINLFDGSKIKQEKHKEGGQEQTYYSKQSKRNRLHQQEDYEFDKMLEIIHQKHGVQCCCQSLRNNYQLTASGAITTADRSVDACQLFELVDKNSIVQNQMESRIKRNLSQVLPNQKIQNLQQTQDQNSLIVAQFENATSHDFDSKINNSPNEHKNNQNSMSIENHLESQTTRISNCQ